ncbi:MAG: hypothetical protein AVDCRST_MAG67-3511 [uncultured Solirubrobacteraceae bacterium]|uniref:Peptidase S1 domain-containing protein n=1 Tax=uncultured Solirubrobacteraceae bacterium TaxID=1162706 RepID=A0A6J4TKM6_9ACTN|nr:MAG: hypothetical protein AVDCRST_MAG67-3511 [uncultured Solirubrobacteraceae bacterium]
MDAHVKTALVAVLTALAAAGSAQAQSQYTRCENAGDATIVEVAAASCDAARAVATALATQPAAASESALRAVGWAPLRAAATDDGGQYDLVAIRGRAALRIRRDGAAPDLDGWAAGRELLFSRGQLVGGRRPPRGSAVCTSAFLIRLGGHPGGLSAAHCGGTRRDGTTHRRNAALRRPPQPGIVVGRVQRNVARNRPLDALVLPVPSGAGRPSAAVVDRGVSRPPWFVAGLGRPTSGRRVCYTGRTSGVDRCGAIVSASKRRAELLLSAFAGTVVRCTTITARQGDSGGPVYTAPRGDGTVYAVGITTLVVGPRARMCFTPLRPVLDALNARLVTAAAG